MDTRLFWVQSRYYDSTVGRFINADDISYLDPETLNGLNLYAYCGNNPVMNVDPSGEFFISLLIMGIVAGALVGGAINGVNAYNSGQRGLGLFGAIAGGAIFNEYS